MSRILYFFVFLTCDILGASPDFREELTKITTEAAKKIEIKYNVTNCGSGGGTMYGIDFAALSFDSKRSFTVEEARGVIVGAADMIKEAINSNKIIRSYLEEYPFPIERIELTFFIRPQSDVKLVSLSKNAIITYSVKDEHDHYKDILEETYPQAKEHLDEK